MGRIRVGKRRKPMMVTHKREKEMELRSRMQWLLDFLNLDIPSLHAREFTKLHIDFVAFIWGFSPSLSLPEMDSIWWGIIEEKERLNECQNMLKEILEKILKTKKKEVLKGVFGGHPEGLDTYAVHYNLMVIDDKLIKIRALGRSLKDEKITIDIGKLADALSEVLSPFPLSRIKTCQKPGCGNYFYQKTTKSKGDFCSPKCRNWATTNRWRENHRDDYNKYHRDRRAKAKEDQVEVKCHSCEFQQTVGSLKDVVQGVISDVRECPTCGKMLLHSIRTWENRKWVEGEWLGSFEWEEFFRNETQKGGNNNG